MVLIIDNYDSFVFNLTRYVRNAGWQTIIMRNNEITIDDIKMINPSHIIISPGPCTPQQSGISINIIKYLHKKYPILGVCLGHQVIGEVFGGRVIKAKHPMHGKQSQMFHSNDVLFRNIPSEFKVGRYHSLIVEHTPQSRENIITTGIDENGEIMSIRHKIYPVYGVQFHPESILTEYGMQIIKNFLN